MVTFNFEHKTVLDGLLLVNPHVRPGKMMGFPGYYVGKKLFACVYEHGISIKLPGERVAKLLKTDPHATPFEPMKGRTMREWVLITLEHAQDYRKYQSVFDESIHYLLKEQGME